MKNKKLKAFVRFDGSGRVVPGSMVMRKRMPKVGRWQEIISHECCGSEDISTTTTTTTLD